MYLIFFLAIPFIFLIIAIINTANFKEYSSFPNSCRWEDVSFKGEQTDKACTRVSMYNSARSDNIFNDYKIAFPGNYALEGAVQMCVEEESWPMGRLQRVEKHENTFWHITLTSPFFGFIDDLLVHEHSCFNGSKMIEVHSEVRLGQSDMGVNNDLVKHFYKCLHQKMNKPNSLAYGVCGRGTNPTVYKDGLVSQF
jgi:uncharacterized protein (DUF1499 family)